jgi:NADPH-dependent ferric siderophore reductase
VQPLVDAHVVCLVDAASVAPWGVMSDDAEAVQRVRRQPSPFRRVTVAAIDDLSPHMRRFVLAGPELDGFAIDAPGASVRLLLPPRGADAIVMPTWTGNQFELPTGERAPIRTFTPRRVTSDPPTLTIDIVLHERGAASDWARTVAVGDQTAVSGPGRGYDIDPATTSYLLLGDATAIPAISQLLEALPSTASVDVEIEVAHAEERLDLPEHAGATVTWHTGVEGAVPGDRLVAVVEGLAPIPGAIWAAGEAAAMQRIRNLLFVEAGLPRSQATVRGYWKHGRSATD